ncbi:DedA family protein [Novipirellula caenicola]|uniref:VTT domain-containing protein n=1 Tax=Novipirellula caenicola TaxID=1536901 RepID=A0ABP9VJT0_9BACT
MSLSLAPLIEQILTWIAAYGLLALGLSIFAAAVGVPLPSTLFVIAAGAFVRQGVLDEVLTPICILACVVLGDVVSFGMGRYARISIERRFGGRRSWRRARSALLNRGGVAIYLTRWMLTAFAVPTNLAAGGGGYPFVRFLAFDVAGEVTWILVFGGLGYAFGSEWEVIGSLASDFSGLLVGIVFVLAGVYFLLKRKRPTQVRFRKWKRKDQSEELDNQELQR